MGRVSCVFLFETSKRSQVLDPHWLAGCIPLSGHQSQADCLARELTNGAIINRIHAVSRCSGSAFAYCWKEKIMRGGNMQAWVWWGLQRLHIDDDTSQCFPLSVHRIKVTMKDTWWGEIEIPIIASNLGDDQKVGLNDAAGHSVQSGCSEAFHGLPWQHFKCKHGNTSVLNSLFQSLESQADPLLLESALLALTRLQLVCEAVSIRAWRNRSCVCRLFKLWIKT